MDEMVEARIDECLDYYDPESRTFPQIASRVSVGGELTKQEVLQILKWKLRNLKDLNAVTISDKNMAKINEAITKACKENGEFSALELLDRIPGVGLAAGTALLSVCYPEKFTTIDWRVSDVLNLFPSRKGQSVEKRPIHNYWTVNDYLVDYLPRVKRQRDFWGCTLQDTYRALCGLSSKRIMSAVEHRSTVIG